MPRTEDEMIKIVNANAEIFRIAEYIVSKYDVFTIEQAKQIVKYLIKEKGYTKNDILSGLADKEIFKIAKAEIIKNSSVAKKGEKKKEVPLKTKKKVKPYKAVAITLALLIAIGGTISIANDVSETIDQVKLENRVTQNIGMLATTYGSEHYEHKMNIVAQNTYVVSHTSKGGGPIVAYYNDKIASDIVQVCTQNPELFDLCMHNVYFEMEYNRLENMDDVLSWLKSFIKDKEEFSEIYSKISSCDVFLEYLIGRGFINPNAPEFYLVQEDIQKYKNSRGGDKIPWNALSKESQERLEKLISAFSENGNVLYSQYESVIEDLVEEQAKKGGR